MKKRAIILAGGKGTRLKPYTYVLPKPLMPIENYPILEIVIRQLSNFGFDHVTLAVNHQAEIIKAFFQNGEKWGIKIDYSFETEPLGTMGPLKLIKDLPDNFLVMNGDVLSDVDIENFHNQHVKNKNVFTISSKLRTHKIDYGVLKIDSQKNLISFSEKPKKEYLVSMGIYMLSKSVLKFIPDEVAYGFDELMIDLIKADKEIIVEPFDGYWLDIGRPDDYKKAQNDIEFIKKYILKDIIL